MTVIAEITTFPLDKGISVSKYVRSAINVLKETGYNYMIGPMSTSVEADTVEELLTLIGKMHNALSDAGCMRIATNIRIDDRRDKKRMGRMEQKVKAVTPEE